MFCGKDKFASLQIEEIGLIRTDLGKIFGVAEALPQQSRNIVEPQLDNSVPPRGPDAI
jgi:hypothetical protein